MKVTEADKVRIKKLHEEGLTSQEIKKKLNLNYTRQQIAAVKAWKTMIYKASPGDEVDVGKLHVTVKPNA